MDNEQESSESTEQDLEQKSTDDTSLPAGESAKEEPQVPLHEHTALRKRAQDAEIEAARAQGALDTLQAQQATAAPADKSPLQAAMEAEGVSDPDELERPFSVMRKQQEWEKKVANQATEKTRKDEFAKVQRVSADAAKAKYPDWQEKVLAANGLFTPGEILDLENAGVNFGEVAYAKAQEVLARSAPKPDSTKTAPETKPSESEAEEEVPTQQEILKDLNVDPATERAAQL